jgi:hypothetical protein
MKAAKSSRQFGRASGNFLILGPFLRFAPNRPNPGSLGYCFPFHGTC